MASHFIHYLKREIKPRQSDVRQKLWFATPQQKDEGFSRPMYHITRSKSGPAASVKTGDTIWLFSCLRSPWGSLPPSLDAMFHIERIENLADGRTKFIAGKDSRWFPLADASSLLQNLYTVNSRGDERKLIGRADLPAGMYLRSIRQLNSATALKEWSSKVRKSELDFISYRIKDGTRPAFQKTKALVARGKVVFWDRYCLPRRLVERRELVDDKALDRHLLQVLAQAARVWGIETPAYFAKDSYAQKEAGLARQQGKYFPVATD